MLNKLFATLAALVLAAPMALWAQAPTNNPANDVGKAVNSPVLRTIESEVGCPTVYGILGSGSEDLPGTSGTHSPRIFRDGDASSCGSPKSWPGTFGAGSYAYDAYTLTNGSGNPQCVNMNVYVFDGEISSQVHITVYSGSFNPGSISTNYLADSGFSALPGGSTGLSFTVGAGQSVVVVLTNPSGSGTGAEYLLSYDNLCVSYDRSYLDDQGRSMICYNSITGQYRWSIFKGLGAGGVWTGQATISNGGNTLKSPLGNTDKLTFYVYTRTNAAYGIFHPQAFLSATGSVLGDVNISDDPPSDCIRILETLPK